MSQVMDFKQFMELVKHIEKDHSMCSVGRNGKTIKYINPVFDMRGCDVFSVTFRGYGWEHNLNCTNENRDLPDSLFDRCMAFLDEA